MKVKFLTKLNLVVEGKKYKLYSPFKFVVYQEYNTSYFTVPKGFITDLASVPRLPFAYLFYGNTGHEAAVCHDYLIEHPSVPKEYADKVFLAGLKEMGYNWFKRYPMYLAVRLFGNKDNG